MAKALSSPKLASSGGKPRSGKLPVSAKNILLISPDSGKDVADRMYLSAPLGVVRLAGYLNAKGHSAEYYDPNLYDCTKKGPSLSEKLAERDWDIIGFSVLEETLIQDIQNIHEAHKLVPRSLIMAGGIEAQFNYQALLDKSPCRIIVLGEGEVPLLMLANEHPWQDIPGIVIKNVATALNQELFVEATELIPWETINYEDYWDVYVEKYQNQWNEAIADQVKTVRIFSKNRCPIGCKYCSSTPQLTLATNGKVPVISTTDESLIRVIERVVEAHPDTRMIYFTDDDFAINKVTVIQFCKKLVERNFGDLIFMGFARVTDLTEPVIEWMSKANFRKLNIGVEAFSQRTLDEIGKRCPADKIHTALTLLKKYDIRPFMNIILTTPESRLEDVELTVDEVIRYLADDFYQAGVIYGIYPLKGTEFFERYWDFKSHVEEIPGTGQYIRRDEIIYANDPLVREFQIRYQDGESSVVDRFVKSEDIRHRSAGNLALIKLQFAKKLITDIRNEYSYQPSSPPAAEHPDSSPLEDLTPALGRPGDTTRHGLV